MGYWDCYRGPQETIIGIHSATFPTKNQGVFQQASPCDAERGGGTLQDITRLTLSDTLELLLGFRV